MPDAKHGGSFPNSRNIIGDPIAPGASDTSSVTAYVRMLAPSGTAVLDYDRHHLALYAALLDADAAGEDWKQAAVSLMGIDLADAGAEACWRSHLERARWIVGDGLAAAVTTFGTRAGKSV